MRVCNAYSKLDLPEQPHLFLEFHGSEASVAEQAERFGDIARECECGSFDWAARAEERTRLWQARHDVFWALRSYRAGAKVVVTDVCVPISGWRNASSRRSTTSTAQISSRPSSGMWATAISMRIRSSTWRTGPRSTRRKASPPGLPIAPSSWADLHRRARRRPEEAGLHGRRARPRGARPDAPRLKASFDPTNLFNPGKVFFA